jgi:hypothetical protein
MRKKKPVLAIIYDFDGTLAPGNMQERDFVPEIGMKPAQFWEEAKKRAKESNGDEILIYMGLMLEKAKNAKVQVKKENFIEYGKTIDLFEGVVPYTNSNKEKERGWFDRINAHGKDKGFNVKHYIVSSGIREMIQGTPISKYFECIFASSFKYEHHGVAEWPALALNYTTKTQYIFRINKGQNEVYKHEKVNAFVPDSERPIPFNNMIFIGDGDTDIPCMRLVKDKGGHSIAVYKPKTKGKKEKAIKLKKDGRVDYIAPADYRNGEFLDKIVKCIIEKMDIDRKLDTLRHI